MENVIHDNRHDINLIKKALISLETPPTYKSPSASLTIKPNLIEQGKSTQVNLQHNYVKNDAGDIISVKYYIGPKEVESPCPISSSTQFKMEIEYSDGPIKDTNLGNPYPSGSIKSGTITVYGNVTAVGLSYYGVGEATNSTLKNTKSFTWDNITCNKDIIIYKYPKSLGALTSIKDSNNFEYINSYLRTEEVVNDITYYVYTLKDPVTITGFKQIYS